MRKGLGVGPAIHDRVRKGSRPGSESRVRKGSVRDMKSPKMNACTVCRLGTCDVSLKYTAWLDHEARQAHARVGYVHEIPVFDKE